MKKRNRIKDCNVFLKWGKWAGKLFCFLLAAEIFFAVPTLLVYAAEIPEMSEEETDGNPDDILNMFSQETIQGTVYLCDFYDIRSEADSESSIVVTVPSGTTVQLMGVDLNREGLWYYVKAAANDVEYYGYVLRSYLAISNEVLLAWEEEQQNTYALNGIEGRAANGIEQFPESYQVGLQKLADKHPNWIFVRYDTGLDWNYVIDSEMVEDRSLVGTYRGDAWKEELYGSNWAYASRSAVQYCMDPRNFLDEEAVFQFEQLTYNASYHTIGATQNILQNTFMNGNMPGSGISYAQNFVEIGSGLRVSPFHLASRVAQEQGNGTSPLISGNYPGYEGYYNYFNIGASGATNEEIYSSGLKRAQEEGWNSPYASIRGGAQIISKRYILRGQDTLYLQKFDVDGSYDGRFWHQYMQNIEAPYSEAVRIARAYKNAGAFGNSFVFKIPVYNNMPPAACPRPEEGIISAGIYLAAQDGTQVIAGLTTEVTTEMDLEYRWLIYDCAADSWSEEQGWRINDEWFIWSPPKTGAYLIQGEVRMVGSDKVVTSVIGYNHVSEDDIYIKGMCQMPYTGEGGGYLIGVETNRNPDQKLQYELLILDCTLLAEGKDAWVWTTGRCGVSDGNAFWAVWQPQYGYYWTLFRVYDENGNLLDEECYGFENIC